MRTIIAGSRTINKLNEDIYIVGDGSTMLRANAYEAVVDAIVRSKFEIDTVISGTAEGVDRMGELWALDNGIPVVFYPPNWREHGKRAGYVRNAAMAANADALIAVWDGESPGTKMMIDLAREQQLMVFVDQVKIEA
jgi:predicted Rossmann fold nucleotide-binding protein DprA/Smf involved in DNA uptake